jgi:HEAT repeat protein
LKKKNLAALLVGCLSLSGVVRLSAATVDVEREKETLIKGRPDEQQRAMANLAKGDNKATAVLCDVIENEKDATAKARAATALDENLKTATNRNEETLTRLERMTQSSDEKVVRLSASSVMHFKDSSRARKILRTLAKEHPDQQVRAHALGAFMVNIDGDKSEIPFVESFLQDKSEYVRVWAAGYLGALGSKSGLALCRDVLSREPLDDKIRALQMRAAIAAGRIGDPSLIPALKKVGASQDYGIAKWEALVAIKAIELKATSDKTERMQYLKTALSQTVYAQWAVQQLMAQGDSDALEILRWAAKSKGLAGMYEAQRAVAVMEQVPNK